MRCLPTLGGQTGLNVAMDLWRHGVLEKFGVEMIGANADVIDKAENRDRFQKAMQQHRARSAERQNGAERGGSQGVAGEIGLPAVVRPSFTMGGSGSAIAFERGEYEHLVRRGLEQSPVHQVLIEESILGWKEYEMEVMRDKDDNVVIICSIENFDPMGIHTGDSITVAPAQTLTDKEYQRMRDASLAVIREIGVETGGSNIQFAIHPRHGADDRHRDEPAGEPLQRAGLEGDRVSDRQDRGQAGRGLSAARAAERHHPRNDGLLRADDRLRSDESAAVCVREIPRCRCDAYHANEKRRRDDGHRQHVQGVVPEGAAWLGSAQRRVRLRRPRSVGHRRAAERGGNHREAEKARRGAGVVLALRLQERHERGRGVRADGHRSVVFGQPA